MSTLDTKHFLRDSRLGKIKKIYILVTEDGYAAEIMTAALFAESERVLIRYYRWTKVSSMRKIGLSVTSIKTMVAHSIKSLYKDLIDCKDVLTEFPCRESCQMITALVTKSN